MHALAEFHTQAQRRTGIERGLPALEYVRRYPVQIDQIEPIWVDCGRMRSNPDPECLE
jgi:hypothetical protein